MNKIELYNNYKSILIMFISNTLFFIFSGFMTDEIHNEMIFLNSLYFFVCGFIFLNGKNKSFLSVSILLCFFLLLFVVELSESFWVYSEVFNTTYVCMLLVITERPIMVLLAAILPSLFMYLGLILKSCFTTQNEKNGL